MGGKHHPAIDRAAAGAAGAQAARAIEAKIKTEIAVNNFFIILFSFCEIVCLLSYQPVGISPGKKCYGSVLIE